MDKKRRISCPDRDRLIKFGWGVDLLPPNDRADIERHLDECSSCREEILSMNELFEAEELPDAVPSAENFTESPVMDVITDLAARFPKPLAGNFSLKKLERWFSELGGSMRGLIESDPSDALMPAVSSLRSPIATDQYQAEIRAARDMLDQAADALGKGKFVEAARLYENCSNNPPPGIETGDLQYMIGFSHLESGRAQAAIPFLRRSINEEAEPLYYWTMVRALLEKGDFREAMSFLRVLAGMDSEYSDEAVNILDTLREC